MRHALAFGTRDGAQRGMQRKTRTHDSEARTGTERDDMPRRAQTHTHAMSAINSRASRCSYAMREPSPQKLPVAPPPWGCEGVPTSLSWAQCRRAQNTDASSPDRAQCPRPQAARGRSFPPYVLTPRRPRARAPRPSRGIEESRSIGILPRCDLEHFWDPR